MTRAAEGSTRVGFVSLGCPKNLVDSEVMMGILARAGAELVAEAADADVVVVNTCGFIEDAREESVEAILEAATLKTTGRCRRLVVAGCLVQRSHEELRREIPEIDAFVGLDDIPAILGIAAPELDSASRPGSGGHIAEAGASSSSAPHDAGGLDSRFGELARRGGARRDAGPLNVVTGAAVSRRPSLTPVPPGPGVTALPDSAPAIRGRATWLYDDASPRVLAGPTHSAYLKIAEGCDNPCAFCAIPSFRGNFRSRRMGSILREAEQLASQGVRELNLIAQDSTNYGHDLGLSDGPARLLRGLDGIGDLRWIRLFYVYPNRITDSLLEAIAVSPRIVKYLDMPLQSGSRSVLARMKRGGSAETSLRLLERMRRCIPGLVLRSTFIVGFPGESDTEFRETLDFAREARFDHLGVFTYSHEEATSAFSLKDDVASETKAERREELLAAQESIALEKNRARLGRTIEVLCEGVHPESDDLLVGRHAGQAPDIDGTVILNEGAARAGEFVAAKVLESHSFDLVARIVGSSVPA